MITGNRNVTAVSLLIAGLVLTSALPGQAVGHRIPDVKQTHSHHHERNEVDGGLDVSRLEADVSSPTGKLCQRLACDPRTHWCDQIVGRCMPCADDCSVDRMAASHWDAHRCKKICAGYFEHVASTPSPSVNVDRSVPDPVVVAQAVAAPAADNNHLLRAAGDVQLESAGSVVVVSDWVSITVCVCLSLITFCLLAFLLLHVHRTCCQPPTQRILLPPASLSAAVQRTISCTSPEVLVVDGFIFQHVKSMSSVPALQDVSPCCSGGSGGRRPGGTRGCVTSSLEPLLTGDDASSVADCDDRRHVDDSSSSTI